jgi:transcriptional regulator with XRE-family HTH domain
MDPKDTIIEDEPYEGYFKDKGPLPPHASDLDAESSEPILASLLKSRRLELGLSLDEVAESTRVRKTYLEALEQMAFHVLPSHAFALGYVRAYARVLGLDEHAMADLYKKECPSGPIKLQAPLGATLDDVEPSNRHYVVVALLVVALIVGWNIFQRKPNVHIEFERKIEVLEVPFTETIKLIDQGLIRVAKPNPPPPDQDIPSPYYTPGLEEGFLAIEQEKQADRFLPDDEGIFQRRRAFNARGVIYGAIPTNSAVILQAKTQATLIIKDPKGTVVFAQSLPAGGAYRLPLFENQDQLVEVSSPRAFELFFNGEYAGSLKTTNISIGQMNKIAVSQAKALDLAQGAKLSQAQVRPQNTIIEAPTLPLASDEPIPYMALSNPTPTETQSSPPTITGPVP